MTAKTVSCYIGTSGWYYNDWIGPFYPEGYFYKDFLSYYSDSFNTVEVNNSFYKLPTNNALKKWKDIVNKNFVFSVKASRYITHMKKLKDTQKSLSDFLSAIRILNGNLGPLLFQLPPGWHKNLERLEDFVKALPRNYKYAFEFRDITWFDERVYKILREHNAGFCIYELAGNKSPEIITSDFVYIRLHGPGNEKYKGNYSTQQLNTWAVKLRRWANEDKEMYCYFDNDQKGYAAKNALALKKIMSL